MQQTNINIRYYYKDVINFFVSKKKISEMSIINFLVAITFF